MKNSIDDIRKKTRGRPRRPTTPVLVRFSDSELTALDRWIADTGEEISRPEAVRRLIQTGLELPSEEMEEFNKFKTYICNIGEKNSLKKDFSYKKFMKFFDENEGILNKSFDKHKSKKDLLDIYSTIIDINLFLLSGSKSKKTK